MRGGVAFLARYRRMFFDEWISSLSMVKLLEGRFPTNKRKILAIVFEVATDAVPAVGVFHSQARVVALMRGQTIRNFLVAFEAFECRRAGSELMAGVALGRAVERLVRFGKRSW